MKTVRSRKEYAIRLNTPQGIYYYRYAAVMRKDHSYGDPFAKVYVFTSEASPSVRRWKTIKFTEKEIQQIVTQVNNKTAFVGVSVIGKKKYEVVEYPIISTPHLKKNMEDIFSVVKSSIQLYRPYLIDSLVKGNIDERFKNAVRDIHSQLGHIDFGLLDSEITNVYMDVVDASYDFRLLKLRTINKKAVENET